MLKFAIALAASAVVTTTANAACTQADLEGTWQIYSAGWSNNESWWSRCKKRINAAGAMSNATCTDSFNQTGPMTNATATISNGSFCTYTAQFTVGNAVNKVLHATLSQDKTLGSGVGSFRGGKFIFTMSKL